MFAVLSQMSVLFLQLPDLSIRIFAVLLEEVHLFPKLLQRIHVA